MRSIARLSIAARLPQAACTLVLLLQPGILYGQALPKSLIVLENEHTTVGILPEGAGRVVHFARKGGKNILKSNPAVWEDVSLIPSPDNLQTSPEIHGQLHWVSPQKDFWNQQTLYPKRKGTQWPPDPWSEVAGYQVISQSPTEVKLVGPESPVTGLQFTKSYRLGEAGELTLDVDAINQRTSPVTWGLWSVTRLDATGSVYAPHNSKVTPRVVLMGKPGSTLPAIPLMGDDGSTFSFHFEKALSESKQRSSKAFLSPDPGSAVIEFHRGDEIFRKSFISIDEKLVAPGHSPIEIYINQKQGDAGTLELEFHGAYRKLEPGESLKMSETWKISINETGEHSQSARHSYLRTATTLPHSSLE